MSERRRATRSRRAPATAPSPAGPTPTLFGLPAELVDVILSQLPVDALAATAATCAAGAAASSSDGALWRALYSARFGASHAAAAAAADDDGAPHTAATWRRRYRDAHEADVSRAGPFFAPMVAARLSVPPPRPTVGRAGPVGRAAVAAAAASPAARLAAWRRARGLAASPTAPCHPHAGIRVPGCGVHACEDCGTAHQCGAGVCAEAVAASGGDSVCRVTGAVLADRPTMDAGGDRGGRGGDDDDEGEEFSGRLGRAFAEGYLGAD